ncbi:MAG: transglutaminase-like domain-containing protein [Pseudomonadota bacterium]
MQDYLQETRYFDYQHPLVREFVERALGEAGLDGDRGDEVQRAVALYRAARDGIRYNPYTFQTSDESFSASGTLAAGQSYCIPKAVLLGAAARAVGIPSRLGLADVKNHLSSPQLLEYLRSDVFRMHGYIELYLDGQWVKATPAFDTRLCQRMGVEPLAFNGREDSIFQPYTEGGQKHMEYLNDHGYFADVPVDFIIDTIAHHYPHLAADLKRDTSNRSLEQDLANGS